METVFKFLAQSERGREGGREKIDQREIDTEGEREREQSSFDDMTNNKEKQQ